MLFRNHGIVAQPSDIKFSFKQAFQQVFLNRKKTSPVAGDTLSSEFLSLLNIQERQALASEHATSEHDQRQKWRQLVGHCVNQFTDRVDEERENTIFQELWEYFRHPNAWTVDEDAKAVAEHLKDRTIDWVLGSNFDRRLHDVVKGHEVFASCQAIFDSASVGYEKPDARFYQYIEQATQAAANEILFVGDDYLNDYVAPRQCGWQSVLFGDDNRAVNRIANLADLISRI